MRARRPLGLASTVIGIAAAALLLSGCGAYDARSRADEAMRAFHRHLDGARYEDIWKSADDTFQKAHSQESFRAQLAGLHEQLGKVVDSRNRRWTINIHGRVAVVGLVQETKFEHGTATETFTFVVVRGVVKLGDYQFTAAGMSTPTGAQTV